MKSVDQTIIHKIYVNFINNIKPHLSNGFDFLNKKLFDKAQKSASNTKQTHYLDAIQVIKASQSEGIECFLATIQNIFDSFENKNYDYFSDAEIISNESSSLSLVDNKKLEESLAKTNIIKQSQAAYHKHLFALNKRFSFLANDSGSKHLKSQNVPVGPYVLCTAFEKSIQSIALDFDIKVIMYKSFEVSVMGQLNPIYSELNALFVSFGIVPIINYDFKRTNTVYEDKKTDINNSLKDSPNKEELGDREAKNIEKTKDAGAELSGQLDQNYQLITQILAQMRKQAQELEFDQNNSMNTIQNRPKIPIDYVLNAVSTLQNNMLEQGNFHQMHSPLEIKEKLIQQIHSTDPQIINSTVRPIDGDIIDLVGLMFQFMVEDRNVPPEIQNILSKLQLPYSKIALQDKNLFADKNHEARKLLDIMATSSIGWSKESDSKAVFLNKIKEVTQHIIEMETYKNKIFEILQINFEAFLSKYNKKINVTIKRTRQRAQGEAKLHKAKRKTAQLFYDNLANCSVSEGLKHLLLDQWSNILILAHLRYSNASEELCELKNFVTKVINYHQFHDIGQKRYFNKLINTYINGLKLVVFQENEINNLSDAFKLLLLESSNEIIDYSHDDIFLLASQYKNNEIVKIIQSLAEPNQKNRSDIDSRFVDRVKDLKLGTWLLISDEHINNQHSIRAKLTWINSEASEYLFVNAKGHKIIEKTAFDLAKGFSDRNIKVLSQSAFFERALSSIANDFQSQSSH